MYQGEERRSEQEFKRYGEIKWHQAQAENL